MAIYEDLGDRAEDDRIHIIGTQVVSTGRTCGFIVEDDDKANRYMNKLREKFPLIREVSRGPFEGGGVWVRVGLAVN